MAAESGKNRIVGSTIADNAVRTGNGNALGGGLLVSGFGEELVPVEVIGSTIASNAIEGSPNASVGADVATFETGQVTFAGSILADGIGGANCGEDAPEGAIASNGFNLDSQDKCGFRTPGDLVAVDPLLGPLQDNGGPTATMLPAAGSLAIDKGRAALGIDGDQRGLARTVNLPGVANSTAPGADGADIGAVEVQSGK